MGQKVSPIGLRIGINKTWESKWYAGNKDFAKYLDGKNQKMWLRYVLVPGFNSDTQTLIEWKNFADSLNNVEKIELLPFRKICQPKYDNLGLEFPFGSIPEPSPEKIKELQAIIKNHTEL